MLKAGVSIRDISPKKGVDLGGYPYFYRFNEGIHDPIYGGALYLGDEFDNGILLLISDLFYLIKPLADRLRKKASELTGFPFERIIVTCSHTHSAPWMSSMFEEIDEENAFSPTIDEEYNDYVIDSYAEIAKEALETTFDAKISFIKAQCGKAEGIGGNRRDPENGPSDEDLPILLVKDKNENLKAIFTKYALHPTILHGENKLVSADYPGAMRKAINKVYPEAVFLFALGVSGDQSPRYFRKDQTFAEVDRFGQTLAKAVLDKIPEAQYSEDWKFAFASGEMELIIKEYKTPEEHKKELERLREKEQELIKAKASYVDLQNANLAVLGAECDLDHANKAASGELLDMYNEEAPFIVNAFLLNDIAFVFLPGEIFVQFGLDIKEKSPFKETHVITLANGGLPGYCVTKEALEEGGYEPYNSLIDPASGDILVEKTIEVLEALKNK